MTHPAAVLLEELLAIPSPPGREGRMAAFLRKKIRQAGFAAETDPAGNLIVRLNPAEPGRPLILAAHMDEIALVVTKIEPDGRLCVTRSGGMMPFKLGERIVDVLGDEEIIQGVVSCGTGHVSNRDAALTWSDYWITTGLLPAQLEARGIHVGAAAVPAREGRGPLVFGDEKDPLVAAWTFDDRVGMLTLLRLLEHLQGENRNWIRPVIVAFTVHEEGGAHGAKNLAHRENPEIFLAVDGCPLTPGTGLELDGRPAVWVKDAKANYDQRLILDLVRVGRANGIPLQRVVLENAYSDASAAYDTGGAPRVAIVGHVRDNSHGFEVARLGVFDQLLELLKNYLGEFRVSPAH